MHGYEKAAVWAAVIVINILLWTVAISLLARAASVFEKPRYDTSPIYCERELVKEDHK